MSLEQVAKVSAMLRSRPDDLTLEERRARFERNAEAFALPPDLRTEPASLRDDLSGQWVWVDGCSDRHAILWLHGGAFFLGSSRSWRHFAARLARASGARVFLLDYRLVPEHPFPAAAVDARHAVGWLETIGYPMERVGIGGDSAGGNLAAGAVQARAAAAEPVPAACCLLSPYLDLTHSGGTVASRAHLDPFVDPTTMPGTAGAYLGDVDPKDPRASPLFGPTDGFPPTLVQVGSDEVLFDDARRFAEALRAGGREALFQEWVGMIHEWPYFADMIDEGGWAIEQAGSFYRRCLF